METHTHCILLFIATAAEHLVVSAHFLAFKEHFQSFFLPGQQKTVIPYPSHSHTPEIRECFCSCIMESNYHTGALSAVLYHERQSPEEDMAIYCLLAAHTCGCVVQFSSEHLETQIGNRETLVDRMELIQSLSTWAGTTFGLVGCSWFVYLTEMSKQEACWSLRPHCI